MTTIKPPGAGAPITPGMPASSPAEPAGSERVGPSFREALERPSGAGATTRAQAPSLGAAGTADPIAELASAVRAGTLSAEQAVERLVENAVGALRHRLSEAQRVELTGLLREAIQNDPALTALRDTLD